MNQGGMERVDMLQGIMALAPSASNQHLYCSGDAYGSGGTPSQPASSSTTSQPLSTQFTPTVCTPRGTCPEAAFAASPHPSCTASEMATSGLAAYCTSSPGINQSINMLEACKWRVLLEHGPLGEVVSLAAFAPGADSAPTTPISPHGPGPEWSIRSAAPLTSCTPPLHDGGDVILGRRPLGMPGRSSPWRGGATPLGETQIEERRREESASDASLCSSPPASTTW
mmetsp:Transcript_81438/g.161979  ORF Transcript_81438/g.161979 Transcript_81438/m.161979 type:complete len:226 (-) Transcript_81438:4-681(-)